MNKLYFDRIDSSRQLFELTQQKLLEKIGPLKTLISSWDELDKARPYEEIKEQLQVLNAQMCAYVENELPTTQAAYQAGVKAMSSIEATFKFCNHLPLLSVAAVIHIPKGAAHAKELKENSLKHEENKAELNAQFQQLETLTKTIQSSFFSLHTAFSEIQKFPLNEL